MFAGGRTFSLLSWVLAGVFAAFSAAAAQDAAPAHKARAQASYARLPLSFEANAGQTDRRVQFLSRGAGYALYLTKDGATLVLRGTGETAPDFMRMQLTGARAATAQGEERLPGTANYFIGNDPTQWHAQIPTCARVRYAGIYPGVDLVYYGNQGRLEYDFVVGPHADAGAIQLRLMGARTVRLARNGDLIASIAHGQVVLHRPEIYQTAGGRRYPVAGSFVLRSRHAVGFRVGHYDAARTLTIDPVLEYSTFLGGSSYNTAAAIAVDAAGDAYVAGSTASTDFPVTTGAYQTTNHGSANQTANAYVAKLNAAGTALVYSTYLGGSGTALTEGDAVNAIAVDSAGNAYVTGSTESTDFPVTPGAFQTSNLAAANMDATAFVTKLNAAGTALEYSSYLGGSGVAAAFPFSGDTGRGIAVDADGDAYVTGQTYSNNFPVTPGAFQTANQAAVNQFANAFITKVNPAGTALVYSTYLGGSGGAHYGNPMDSGAAIAVDSTGSVYVAGQTPSRDFPVTEGAFQSTLHAANTYSANAFVARLNPAGSALMYSTYLGGSLSDTAAALAVDSAGNAYVAGSATSADFPVTQGAFQVTNHGTSSQYFLSNAFVTKLNATGTQLVYSTYLGGSGGVLNFSPTLEALAGDAASGLAVDSAGDAYVTGSTPSPDFPVTTGAYQTVNQDQRGCTTSCIGGYNAFVTELNPAGSALAYSTYLGGNGVNPIDLEYVIEFGDGDPAVALALDASRNVYVTGNANSSDFPVTGGAIQTAIGAAQSTFITKMNLSGSQSTGITPKVTVTPSAAAITSAQTMSVTVTVSGGSGAATPTGSVNLSSPGFASPAIPLNEGSATFDLSKGVLQAFLCYQAAGLPIPQDLLAANYIPDAASAATYNFASGQGAVTVVGACATPLPASLSLTVAQAQSQATTFSIVASSAPGEPVPTGTVTLSTGAYTSPSATLTDGTASLSIPAGTLSTGFNIVYTNYGGDGNYVAVPQSSNALVTVGGVTVTVVPSILTIPTTQPLPVTITVSGGSGNPVPTGTVMLTSGGYTSASVGLTNGAATITIPAGVLPPGTDGLEVQYGDGNYAGATGSAQVTVTGKASFTVASNDALGLTPGQSGPASVVVTPMNGFTGSVAMTAAFASTPADASNLPTLSFGNTATVNITSAASVTATLTVGTMSGSRCDQASLGDRGTPWLATAGGTLACVLLLGVPARRRNWRTLLGMMLLLAAFGAGGLACGGNSSQGCTNTGGTSPGNYVISVTGTSGTATASGTVALTVQ